MKPFVNKAGETVLEISTREVRAIMKAFWESQGTALQSGWVLSLRLSPKYAVRIKDEDKIIDKDNPYEDRGHDRD